MIDCSFADIEGIKRISSPRKTGIIGKPVQENAFQKKLDAIYCDWLDLATYVFWQIASSI